MPRAFVIQGFGQKQDYQQQKTFNLDASYEIVKEALMDVGFECYRADELRGAGSIETVMYQELLDADLVVADITTLNFNAAYELGVRCALRPRSTIIIGEKGLNFPFDVNHLFIHTYVHLGPDVGRQEAKRLTDELKKLATQVLHDPKPDSPVYLFLPHLPRNGYISHASTGRTQLGGDNARTLMNKAKEAQSKGEFSVAASLWEKAKDIAPKDDFIIQQLALATYKSKEPTAEIALWRALDILLQLQPDRSFDVETLGLWAAVHKRLFEINGKSEHLDQALFALERGFFIKKDYYNGINLAFMLDIKARLPGTEGDELHAVASFVRRQVVKACNRTLAAMATDDKDRYWVTATLFEAHLGLGDEEEAEKWHLACAALNPDDWMKATTHEQTEKVRRLRGVVRSS